MNAVPLLTCAHQPQPMTTISAFLLSFPMLDTAVAVSLCSATPLSSYRWRSVVIYYFEVITRSKIAINYTINHAVSECVVCLVA